MNDVEKHHQWLIDQYNRNRPIEDHVKNMIKILDDLEGAK